MKDTRRKSEAAPAPAAADGGDLSVDPALKTEATEATTAAEPKEAAVAEEEDEDMNDGDEEEEEEEEEVKEAPKLEDGFFEIEDIRKKRVRQGKLQFLIKWRGWPESANTWEPVENLESCTDIIEAFEERQRAGSSGKRRRRQGGSQSASKSKKNRSARVPTVQDSYPLELFMRQVKAKVEANANCVDGDGGEEDEGKDVVEGKVVQEANGSIDELNKENQKEADGHDDQTKTSCAGNISIDLSSALPDEDGSMDGSSRVPSDGSPFKGAKKRKSGSVRRFKQDTVRCDQEGDHNVTSITADGPCSRNEEAGSTEDETSEKNKPGDSGDPPSITKIIMPVRYFASVTNNVQEVAIKFKALRSDGKEVLVDDKELKANNPHLLISYYEQHLRYTPHA